MPEQPTPPPFGFPVTSTTQASATPAAPAEGNQTSSPGAIKPLEITLSMNVLNHLGINLYSNVPAVVSEIVANCWDADAEKVDIKLDAGSGLITIEDSGTGMSYDDVNQRYLRVGYEKRTELTGGVTSNLKRRPMGRKGIGKLSLFSIAEEYELHTVRGTERTAFKMNLTDVRTAISGGSGTYYPKAIPVAADLQKGTRIVVTKSRKKLHQTEGALRRRLARRFSVIGPLNKFQIIINTKEITVKDRAYFNKVQYLWEYGKTTQYASLCENLEQPVHAKSGTALVGTKDGKPITEAVGGWIGTVAKSSDLKDEGDNINQIVVMVRGKVAHEDVLATFAEGGLYTRYVIGELHADFLDVDDDDDIATSSRQRIVEDDPRFVGLLDFVRKELTEIGTKWADYRDDGGKDKAVLIPAIKEWYDSLSPDNKVLAKKLFGRINRLTVDSEEERLTLFRHGVLAFESLRYKESLSLLDKVSVDDLEGLTSVFANLDNIEAGLYYQIVKERIAVIQALQNHVKDNSLEKVVQALLFKHLWLLDPSWERATDSSFIEQQVHTEFGKIDAGLTADEKSARIDIKYKKTSGCHVIVELKRPDRVCSTFELGEQVSKYRSALRKLLEASNRPNEPIAIVCIVGKELSDWSNPGGRQSSVKMLEAIDTRVVMYQELLDSSSKQYQSYIEKSVQASQLFTLLKRIEDEVAAQTPGEAKPALKEAKPAPAEGMQAPKDPQAGTKPSPIEANGTGASPPSKKL